jgi:hypothetical protein
MPLFKASAADYAMPPGTDEVHHTGTIGSRGAVLQPRMKPQARKAGRVSRSIASRTSSHDLPIWTSLSIRGAATEVSAQREDPQFSAVKSRQ